MATAAAVILSGRYDLKDTDSLVFSDAELLDYLNRAIVQLENGLSAMGSDWVFAEDTGNTTLSEDDSSVDAPARCITVHEIYTGQDLITRKSPTVIYQRRKDLNGAEGRPRYFAHKGTTIIFDYIADTDYALDIYFDQRTAALSSSTSMPHNDEFNQALREAMVMYAHKRNEYSIDLDSVIYDWLLGQITGRARKRTHPYRDYYLGF